MVRLFESISLEGHTFPGQAVNRRPDRILRLIKWIGQGRQAHPPSEPFGSEKNDYRKHCLDRHIVTLELRFAATHQSACVALLRHRAIRAEVRSRAKRTRESAARGGGSGLSSAQQPGYCLAEGSSFAIKNHLDRNLHRLDDRWPAPVFSYTSVLLSGVGAFVGLWLSTRGL
jgi:hypothetical protein